MHPNSVQSDRQKVPPDPETKHREQLSANALAERLVEWMPDMDACGEEGGLPLAIAEELRVPAMAAFDAAMHAVFTAGSEVQPCCQLPLQQDLRCDPLQDMHMSTDSYHSAFANMPAAGERTCCKHLQHAEVWKGAA